MSCLATYGCVNVDVFFLPIRVFNLQPHLAYFLLELNNRFFLGFYINYSYREVTQIIKRKTLALGTSVYDVY